MADPYNLKKRGKFWVPDFTLHGQRVHRSTKCTVKAEAVARCDEWARAIRDEVDGKKPIKAVPTLAKAIEAWEKATGAIHSKKHVDGTAAKLRLHFADQMEMAIDDLDTKIVRAVRSAYVSTPGPTGRMHKNGGANSLIKALNTVLGFFVEDGTLATRPFKVRRLREPKVPRRVVPIQDTAAFLKAVDAPYKGSDAKHSPKAKPKNPDVCLAIKMMLALGLRENETLNSRAEWIDWANRTYYAGETKNGDVRLIPIPRWFLEQLRKHLDGRKTGLVMTDPDGTPHRAQFTKKVLNQVGRELSLPGLTPHRLRATFATNHARAGTDVRKIQVWLDHAHIETTMIYIEFVDDGSLAAQDRVEAMMGLTPKKKSPIIHPK